ncbi:hypothetical protein Btru_035787 [Bulinus truncatus]|nr:hypothetical protein Btru_035787 [Bulinus truncatus]
MGLLFKMCIRYNITAYQIIFPCDRILLHSKLHCRSLKSQYLHTGPSRCEKDTSKPYKFTTSLANTPLIPQHKERNKYQQLIVAGSLSVFLIYFLYLREENDLDELMYTPLHLSPQQYSQNGQDATDT